MTDQSHIYTVSEITRNIKALLEGAFNEIWVEGEISGVRCITTGTIFFNLKDDSAILRGVIFSSNLEGLKFEIKDGIKVICFGKVGVYDKRGDYQLYVNKIEAKGLGSLQLALEQLKQKLEKEGLFRQERKRPMPYLPSRIGIVTSATGAAIKDILKVIDRRFSDVHIIISPAQVQGEGAKQEIAKAISQLNLLNEELPLKEKIEVMIVGRGGGSIEDLWAFNEEIVARAIYNSKIPVISAVGHERDWTISDLVADLRAPTPSVAAELVLPKKEELRERLSEISADLKRAFTESGISLRESLDELCHRFGLSMQNICRMNQSELESIIKKMALLNPLLLLKQHQAKICDLARQMSVRISAFVRFKESELKNSVGKLNSLSPLNILNRGYSITFKMPGEAVLKESIPVKSGDIIKTKLNKRELLSKVLEVKTDG